jgi:putative heme iron utilization protein
MNDDHGDAVAAYARHFAGRTDVETATLTHLAADAMTLEASSGGSTTTLRIAFDHALRDTDDARDTLIAMARAAMQRA